VGDAPEVDVDQALVLSGDPAHRGHHRLEQPVVLDPSEHAWGGNGHGGDNEPPPKLAQVVTQRHASVGLAPAAQGCHV
jgi:hypothetical protein